MSRKTRVRGFLSADCRSTRIENGASNSPVSVTPELTALLSQWLGADFSGQASPCGEFARSVSAASAVPSIVHWAAKRAYRSRTSGRCSVSAKSMAPRAMTRHLAARWLAGRSFHSPFLKVARRGSGGALVLSGALATAVEVPKLNTAASRCRPKAGPAGGSCADHRVCDPTLGAHRVKRSAP
jgi:hypothetical protein